MSIPYDFDANMRDSMERLEWEDQQRLRDIQSEIQLMESHRRHDIPNNERKHTRDMCQFYLDQAREESEDQS